MATSKYDRELRFIDAESKRLGAQLRSLRETMPADPAEAAVKAENITAMEARLSQLLARKKEIEDSYIAAGMDIPDVSRNLNANIWREGRNYDSTGFKLDEDKEPAVKPEGTVEDLTAEIESVTDELMGIEIKMLRADMNGDEDEKQKLSMMASTLRSRRDSLVEQVKALKAEAERAAAEPAPVQTSELESRIESLENDNRAIRSQLSDVRNDMADVKEALRQILGALRLDE